MAGLELKTAVNVTGPQLSMDKDSSLPLAKTKSHGDRKYSIDMGVHHSLEWNVTSYEVGSGKGKKSILNLIGKCVLSFQPFFALVPPMETPLYDNCPSTSIL
jgi:hypothetical protein